MSLGRCIHPWNHHHDQGNNTSSSPPSVSSCTPPFVVRTLNPRPTLFMHFEVHHTVLLSVGTVLHSGSQELNHPVLLGGCSANFQSLHLLISVHSLSICDLHGSTTSWWSETSLISLAAPVMWSPSVLLFLPLTCPVTQLWVLPQSRSHLYFVFNFLLLYNF